MVKHCYGSQISWDLNALVCKEGEALAIQRIQDYRTGQGYLAVDKWISYQQGI